MEKNQTQAGRRAGPDPLLERDVANEIALHSFTQSSPGALGPGVDFNEFLRRLYRHRWLITAVVFGGTLAMVIAVVIVTPRYTATAKVMVDKHQAPVVEISPDFPRLPINDEAVDSEVHVITSSQLAGRIVDKLNLLNDPEFKPKLEQQDGEEQTVAGRIVDKLNLLNDPEFKPKLEQQDSEEQTENGIDRTAELRAQIIENLLERVSVKREGQSRVIGISVESQSRQSAMNIANAIADEYLLQQLETRFESTHDATEWLNERLEELREAVEASELAVEEYRQEAGLLKGQGDATITSQQLTELTTELMIARAKRTEAQAALQQIQGQSASPSAWEAIPEVLSNPVIANLRSKEDDILQEIAEQSAGIAPGYSRREILRAQLKTVRENIAAEINRIAQALRNRVKTAGAREQALEASLKKLETLAAKLNARQGRLRALEREAMANQALLETFLQGYKQTSAMQEFKQADGRVIAYAELPLHPSFPKKKLLVSLAFIGSLGMGIVLALLRELLDAGFRTADQLERHTRLRNLAVVPSVSDLNGAPGPERHAKHNFSLFGESLRTLYANLAVLGTSQMPKCLLFTSACPGEGKTTIALAFARLLASQGSKVVLIDCDLRRGRIQHELGTAHTYGLSDLLQGNVGIEDVVQADVSTTLKIIVSGDAVDSPLALFNKGALVSLLSSLAEYNYFVIIDSPPVLAVADACLLSRIVDKTVYVVRWAKIPRDQAEAGLKQLRENGADLAGTVLNGVDIDKYAEYAYSKPHIYKQAVRYYYGN